jgi:hypothetical protein
MATHYNLSDIVAIAKARQMWAPEGVAHVELEAGDTAENAWVPDGAQIVGPGVYEVVLDSSGWVRRASFIPQEN